MKIRLGLVSNSSSSCYIVNINKDFIITIEDLKNLKYDEEICESEVFCDYDEENDNYIINEIEAIKELNTMVNKLRNKNTLHRQNNELLMTLVGILQKSNQIVHITDGYGDGEDRIEQLGT